MKQKQDGIIEIGGTTYKLKYIPDLEYAGKPTWGQYVPDRREILIEANGNAQYKQNILLHEIVYGILEHAGLGPDTMPDNEKVVNALAYGLESVKINGNKLLR